MEGEVARPCRRPGLLGLGLVEVGWLAGPAFVRQASKVFDLLLAEEVLLLLFDSRCVMSDVAKPLVPLGWNPVVLVSPACQ